LNVEEVRKILDATGAFISEEVSFTSPVLRRLYLQGYKAVLPARAPDRKLRGLLFCSPLTGAVRFYLFAVHVGEGEGDSYLVVRNYLDYLAVSEIAEEFGIVPVLTGTSIGRTARIFEMTGYKVGSPDYGRFLLLPVEDGQLWEMKRSSPGRFKERFLELVEAAGELSDEKARIENL